MTSLLQKRFQLQLLFALVASASVAALMFELVLNAVQHAESFVLSDAERALDHGLQELGREYRMRLRSEASTWADLPPEAQSVTLRAISQTVLSSYPGVEGGFWTASQFVGYAYPTHDGGAQKMDVPSAERPDIEGAILTALREGKNRRVIRGKHDIVIIAASAEGPIAAWAMKRLPGQAEPAQRTRSILLAALVAAALLSAGGVLATAIGLHRGVSQIKGALAALDNNLVPELPVRRDELGEISAAINEMARTRNRLEAEVRREDRARTMGHLVGRIAHELRNPLNSIRLSLQMLASRQETNRLRPLDFRIVIDEVDRMNLLLSDLLAFQQPRPARLELREIGPLLDECAQSVRHQAGKQGVDVAVAGELRQATLLDEQYFRQIMVNLILNALDVSRPGERIAIEATNVEGRVAIEVSDRGPGLTPEQQEHLFEPFFTTKAKGHGLGLAISRELAQCMGANLFYREPPTGGATFVLRLRRTDGK